MLNSGKIVGLTRMWSIRCYECGDDLRVCRFLQSGEEEGQCG